MQNAQPPAGCPKVFNGFVRVKNPCGDTYEGHWLNDKRNGHGVLRRANGNTYDGQWKNDKKHGHGVWIDICGARYEGNWEDDKEHGHGTCSFPDGREYTGNWSRGIREGRGTLVDRREKHVYDGMWHNDKQNGHGVLVAEDGHRYDGNWKDDALHGIGSLVMPCGARFECQWHDGKRHGVGKLTYASGETYHGDWANDMRHGQGTQTLPDASRYQGSWVTDKCSGKGTMIYADNMFYEGNWKSNVRSGQGVLYRGAFDDRTNVIYSGGWRLDQYHGDGTLFLADGVRVCSVWAYGQPGKTSTIVYADGTRFEGSCDIREQSVVKKKGVLTLLNGDQVRGQWKNNVQHGSCVVIHACGNERGGQSTCTWNNGVPEVTRLFRTNGFTVTCGWDEDPFAVYAAKKTEPVAVVARTAPIIAQMVSSATSSSKAPLLSFQSYCRTCDGIVDLRRKHRAAGCAKGIVVYHTHCLLNDACEQMRQDNRCPARHGKTTDCTNRLTRLFEQVAPSAQPRNL